MTIQNGAMVKLHYTLTVDGYVVESTMGGDPLSYVHGKGETISGLEQRISGLNPGDHRLVEIPPEEAYGQPDPTALQQAPKSVFRDPGVLQVGMRVSGQGPGMSFQAMVSSISDDKITLDLNHPLAGKTLRFEVEVVDVTIAPRF
ncbi:MAG: peptidylprolyl isomerase [Elusimicrobia bacterium]|nr:peptidylprolyl isomerase [Elusimicrobiota bacterium]